MPFVSYPGRRADVGGPVLRLLPRRDRRTVGPWCFVDLFDGPSPEGHFVAPHPHAGLQTVTWLLDGEVRHGDSLGHDQTIRPGQLNLMTAGEGIVHWERTAPGPRVRGAQLWVALPDAHRRDEPSFDHHAELPTFSRDGATVTVLMGELEGVRSPARALHPMVGASVHVRGPSRLSLEPGWEHALVVTDGAPRLEGAPLDPGALHVIEGDALELDGTGRALLLGGAPFGEAILMWWNYVARTPTEIEALHRRWEEGGFGDPSRFEGEPVEQPPLPPLATPRTPS